MNAPELRVEEAPAPYRVTPLLTDHLDTFASTPEGFKQLRELVLNLAVRGRLVPQDQGGWKQVCVSDICSLVTDGEHATPTRTHDSTAIPLVTAKNVRNGQMDYGNTDYVPMDVAKKCWQRCKPETGDVLMVSVGATLGRLTVLREARDMVLVRSVTLLRPVATLVTSDYLALHLNSPSSQQEIWSVVRQSAQPCLYLGKSAALKIALPPLAEQSRIVAKVEELMALIDALETIVSAGETARGKLLDALLAALADSPDAAATADAWAQLAPHFDLLLQAPADVDRLQQTLLQLAVKGRLVPQDPKDEPATELLKRIRAEKERLVAEGKIKREKPLLAVIEDEHPFVLPDGWQWVRLNQLLSKIGAGSTPLGGKEVYVSSGVKFLRSQNVWNEGLRLTDTAYIKQGTHEKMSGTKVLPNDLLFNITGASIGRCAVVPESIGDANVSQHVTIVRPVFKDTTPYLHLVLISAHVQRTVMDVQVGVSREGLSIGKLEKFVIPLPPLPEQSRIVAAVASLVALCDRLRERHAARRALSSQFAAALIEGALS